MVVHDYPVKRLSLDDLERRASDFRTKCGIGHNSAVNVQKLLFEQMPEFLQKFGITLVERTTSHMGEREAYASPKAKRIFYRRSLLARLKFGDASAAIIFVHELAHILLHRDNGGAEKAWLKDENTRVSFVSEEQSAEWQATALALCIMAPASLAGLVKDAEELVQKYHLDEKHAVIRFEALRRKCSRKVPEIYKHVRAQLTSTVKPDHQKLSNRYIEVDRLCPCGSGKLLDVDGRYYCSHCRNYGNKLQDGDTA